MLKKDLMHQIITLIGLYNSVKIKKVVGLMKNELGRKIMKGFVALRPKTYS